MKSDNGGEYTGKQLKNWCRDNDIVQHFTCPDTPEQNGVAERCWGILKEMARHAMIEAEMAPSFWQQAMSTACHVANRMSTKSHPDTSPIQLLTGEKPNNDYFRRFGSLAFPVTPGYKKSFQPRAEKGIMVGYAAEGYVLYIPKRTFLLRSA